MGVADYFKHVHSNLATRYRPEDNYTANLMGALAQNRRRRHHAVDWCHNITTLEHAERAVDGLTDSGIRAVFAHGTAKPIGPKPARRSPTSRIRGTGSKPCARGGSPSDAAADARHGDPGARLGRLGGVEHDIRMARGNLARFSVAHRARRETRGAGRLRKDGQEGLLGPDHNLVHGTSYDTADLCVVRGLRR